jgi:hypothetical protein
MAIVTSFDSPAILHCPACEPKSQTEGYDHDYDFHGPRRSSAARQRKPSAARALVGIVGGGVLGIALGAYALLWLLGPDGDLFQLAKWLPDALLPPSVQHSANVK